MICSHQVPTIKPYIHINLHISNSTVQYYDYNYTNNIPPEEPQLAGSTQKYRAAWCLHNLQIQQMHHQMAKAKRPNYKQSTHIINTHKPIKNSKKKDSTDSNKQKKEIKSTCYQRDVPQFQLHLLFVSPQLELKKKMMRLLPSTSRRDLGFVNKIGENSIPIKSIGLIQARVEIYTTQLCVDD